MQIEDLRNTVTRPLLEKGAIADSGRIISAYDDLLHIHEIADEIEASIPQRGWRGEWYALTLLKALYTFVDIFIQVLLREVTQKPGLTFTDFMKRPNLIPRLSLDAILPVYCVVTYRNKIIIHHDMIRMHAYEKDGETYRLHPHTLLIFLQPEDQQAIEDLKQIYQYNNPKLAAQHGYAALYFLFCHIPIQRGEQTENRKDVDGLIERLGCASFTRGEVIEAVDNFAIAINNAM